MLTKMLSSPHNNRSNPKAFGKQVLINRSYILMYARTLLYTYDNSPVNYLD